MVALLACGMICACSEDDDDEAATAPEELAAPVLPAEATPLDRDVVAIMTEAGTPGVQVAAVKDGAVVWSNAYGSAVLEPLPEASMTEEHILNIGSVSKLLVAVACMQQVEKGMVGLDNDVGGILPWPMRNPDFPDVPITWRMLMTHTSSINDSGRAFDASYIFGADDPTSLADFMTDLFSPDGSYYGPETFNRVRPGTAYVNSTYGVALAAYAIERIVGQPFHSYVRERILEPLGVDSTSYFLADLPAERLAVPYTCNRNIRGRFVCSSLGTGDTVLAQQYSYANYPDRLVRTSAREYAKLVALLLEGGRLGETTLLSPESIDQMFTPGSLMNDFGTAQGLIFFADEENPAWALGGSDRGIAAAALLEPGTRLGALAFANSQTATQDETTEAMRRLVRRVLADFR